MVTKLTEYYVKWQFSREVMYTYIPNLTFCDQYCKHGRGRDLFPHFPYKINHVWQPYHDITQLLGKMAVLKRGVVDLHIHKIQICLYM